MSSHFKLMLPIDRQETNERLYCRKHIDGYIRTAIEDNPDMMARVELGAKYLQDWLAQDYYESKNRRLAQIKEMDLKALTLKIFTNIAYCQAPETFVSVTAQMAGYLGFDDKKDSITTVAELVAVLCHTDAYDIFKDSPQASLMVLSRVPLPKELKDMVARSKYVLPMVSEPAEITSNFESPYLTFNECQILGKGNAHDGDICLDVINTQNQVALKMDLDFLCTVEEVPNHALDSLEKYQLWHQFKRESYETYHLLARQGNQFWLTHRVDTRGRLYAHGYHVNTQGTAFKKAMLELADEEVVEGVPTH